MPSSRLLERFEIITRISGGALQIYLARERATGKDVLVRELAVEGAGWKKEEIAERTKARVAELEPGVNLTSFADADVNAEGTKAWVVVWAEKEEAPATPRIDAPPTPPAPSPFATPAAAPPGGEPGEFTRMFAPPKARHIQTAEPISLAGGSAPPPEVLRNAPPPAAKPMESGEFTKMFGTPVAKSDATVSFPGGTTSFAKPVAPAEPKPDPPAQSPDEVRRILDLFAHGSPAPGSTPVPKVEKPATPSSIAPLESAGSVTQVFGGGPKSPPQTSFGSAPTAEVKAPITPAPPPERPAEKSGAGEFTRMFGSRVSSPMGEPAPPRAQSTSSPSPPANVFPAPKEEEKQQAGSFTQLFGAMPSSPIAPERPRNVMDDWGSASTPKVSEPSGAPPSEFTQMFQNPQKAHPSSQAATPFAKNDPFPGHTSAPQQGELTKLFSMKAHSTPEAPPLDPFAAPSPATPPASSGSSTQFFSQSPAINTPPNAPPTPSPFATSSTIAPPASSGATRIFSQPQPSAPVAPPPPSGPGEYTRMISPIRPPQPATPGGVAPAGAPATPPQPPTPPVQAPQLGAPQITPPQFTPPQYTPPQYTPPQYTPPQYTPPQMGGGQMMAPGMQPPGMQAPYYQPPQVTAPQVQPPQMQAPQFQAPAPPAATPSAPQKTGLSGMLPVILILMGLVIVALLLVLIFALKH